MAGNELIKDPLEGLRDLCTAEMWGMGVEKVQEPPRRLEVGFFGSEGYQAVEALHRSKFKVNSIGAVATVVWPGVFARKFVKNSDYGIPFLTTSIMMEARPRPTNFLSHKNTKNMGAYLVVEDTILISRSGTVGNVALVTSDIAGWAVSDDAIRVRANEPNHLGPLYCFLQSPLGQFLLQKNQTGSVVRHIYEADVSGLPVPRLPRALREELTRLVKQTSALRVRANQLLDEANDLIYAQNNLKHPLEMTPAGPKFGSESAARLRHTGNYKGNLRFDVSAFQPEVQHLRSEIKETAQSLRELVNEVIYIGKVYRVPIADASRGTYLLSGKDLVFIRPGREKVLSILNTSHIRRCLLKRGWVLVSRSGTPGRVSIVHRNYENFVGSEHVLRIVPDPGKLDPYYLSAFLSSDAGQRLMNSLIYGSVILTLSKEQLESIPIPIPNDRGEKVGAVVRRAYDARADAEEFEDQAVALFMSAVKQGRQAIESKWGGEY